MFLSKTRTGEVVKEKFFCVRSILETFSLDRPIVIVLCHQEFGLCRHLEIHFDVDGVRFLTSTWEWNVMVYVFK